MFIKTENMKTAFYCLRVMAMKCCFCCCRKTVFQYRFGDKESLLRCDTIWFDFTNVLQMYWFGKVLLNLICSTDRLSYILYIITALKYRIKRKDFSLKTYKTTRKIWKYIQIPRKSVNKMTRQKNLSLKIC